MAGIIIGALFPIFTLVALGFACGRFNLLGDNAEPVLTRFVASFALPALTFVTIAQLRIGGAAVGELSAVVLGASGLVYLAILLIERLTGANGGEANISAFACAYPNCAFVGLPVCLAVLGGDSLAPAAVVVALQASFVFGTGVLVAEMVKETGDTASHWHSAMQALMRLGTNPLILSAVAGALVASFGIDLPIALQRTMDTLGGATGACALVAIGMFMARPFERVRPAVVTRLGLAKLVALPVVTMMLLGMTTQLPVIWKSTAMLMAAMPAGAGAYVVALQSGERSMRIAATMIVFTTLGAALTLPLMLLFLDRVGLYTLTP